MTSSLAGPWCTQILASLGADIVKVEHPAHGDEARAWGPEFYEGASVMFFVANAGKRSLALDIKTDAGLAALQRVAERADVFVQSMRPGAAERLGFGPERLRATSPRLVYLSIGAFGRRGPLARAPGYDPLMQAYAGILSITGEQGRSGVRVGTSVVDLGTGVWAALAVVAALHERERTGVGRTLDISLFETALALVPYQIADNLETGAVPATHGTGFPLIVPYEVFDTMDGAVMIAAANDRLFGALCETLGIGELARDPRFETNPLRVEHRDELLPPLRERISRESTASLLDLLGDAGVPASPVQDIGDVAHAEQTQALEILQQLAGKRTVAPPVSADDERLTYPSPPPRLGEHSREILREAGHDDAELDELERDGVLASALPQS